MDEHLLRSGCGPWAPVVEGMLTANKQSLGLLTTSGTTISCVRFTGRRVDARWLMPQPVTIRFGLNAHYLANAVRRAT